MARDDNGIMMFKSKYGGVAMEEENKISELTNKVHMLEAEVQRLQSIFDLAGIPYKKETQCMESAIDAIANVNMKFKEQGERIIPETITPKHANYFYSFFKGRQDVYSKRSGKPNKKTWLLHTMLEFLERWCKVAVSECGTRT
ncbi:MAG: hypothetical protein Q4B70_15655 [Lachnospiraceae bacterium]|nr:hypothetical protein [Lachnospiraceae bacterium]